nr:hypothetical protein [Microvirga aerophila]
MIKFAHSPFEVDSVLSFREICAVGLIFRQKPEGTAEAAEGVGNLAVEKR